MVRIHPLPPLFKTDWTFGSIFFAIFCIAEIYGWEQKLAAQAFGFEQGVKKTT